MTTAQAWGCADARPSLGVYVLGAIEAADREPVDAHLACCRGCRDELDGLTGLPALLDSVSRDKAGKISADDLVS
jgi:Putative zinc-finger